jgi:hypothetical protein
LAGYDDFWDIPEGEPCGTRWVNVTRARKDGTAAIAGILDLTTHAVTPRPDWPAPRPQEHVTPSPSGTSWLLCHESETPPRRRVWTLALDAANAPFVEHDLLQPPDSRIDPAHLTDPIWLTDRELLSLSQGRYFIVYDVVESRRTRIVEMR